MLIPDNQRTTENIKKNIYDNIRNTYYNYALRWNAIWCVWRDNSPSWGGRWVGGWKGSKIQMYDKIPYELRQTKTKAYEGITGEVNPNVSVESQRIHTTGNENYIRGSLNNFNKTLIEKFKEGEYNGAGGFLTYNLVKSYGVKYKKYDLVGNLIDEPKYYVKDFERFDDDYVITLYTDEDCNNQYLETPIIKWEDEQKYQVVWTGERYYKTITVNPYKTVGEKPYTFPSISSNNPKNTDIIVSNAQLGEKTFELFNGKENKKFMKNVSESNPVIIYFQIGESLKVRNYTMIADNGGATEYPIDWKLQGSNDKNVWVNVDIKSNQTFTKGQSRTFLVTSPNYYLFYRLCITKYNNPSAAMELRRFTFYGSTIYSKIDYAVMQPFNIGYQTSVDVSSKGVRKDSVIESSSNNYNKFSSPEYINNTTKVEDNMQNIYTYNVNYNWSLNNVEQNVRQDNLVKKEDYEQLNRLLNKINSVLKLRDGWFDSNGRCSHSCQVNCQNKCQLSCQACNTKQCHNQKCGTH